MRLIFLIDLYDNHRRPTGPLLVNFVIDYFYTEIVRGDIKSFKKFILAVIVTNSKRPGVFADTMHSEFT